MHGKIIYKIIIWENMIWVLHKSLIKDLGVGIATINLKILIGKSEAWKLSLSIRHDTDNLKKTCDDYGVEEKQILFFRAHLWIVISWLVFLS